MESAEHRYVPVNSCGVIAEWPNATCGAYAHLNVYPYVGDIIVMADQMAPAPFLGPVGAKSHVDPMPTVDATTGFTCKFRPVTVSGYNFHAGATVRFELLDESWNVMDTQWATVDGNGHIGYPGDPPVTLNVTIPGYSGNARVIADEQAPWGQTQGTQVQIC